MNTKIFATILMSVMMIAICASLVLAEDNSSTITNSTDATPALISANPTVDNATVDAQIQNEASTDDNATVRFGQIGWDNVKLFFARDQVRKAQIELDLARLRLIQARIAAKNNDTTAMQNALDAHQRILERLNQTMDQLETGSDMPGLNSSAVKLIGLERAIQVHQLRIERLNNTLANANLTDEQRSKVEDRLSHVQNVTGNLQERAVEKEDKIKTRMMAVGNLTEEQAAKLMNREAKVSQRIADLQVREANQVAREANQTARIAAREANQVARQTARAEKVGNRSLPPMPPAVNQTEAS